MVKGLSIFFMVVTLLISVGLPIGLTIYMYRKYKISIKAVLVGSLMFIVFQFILRIPILSYVQAQYWYKEFSVNNMVIIGIIMAFTAGLFETAGRYVGFKILLKNVLERKNGIAYGIGHGGIESIGLVGVAYIANLYYSIMINTGSISNPALQQLINLPSNIFLAAGVERLFTIIVHIALSLLVLYGIMYNKKVYILYCLLLHTLLDGVVIILKINRVSMWGIEVWIILAGIAALIFIIKSKKMFFPNEKNTII